MKIFFDIFFKESDFILQKLIVCIQNGKLQKDIQQEAYKKIFHELSKTDKGIVFLYRRYRKIFNYRIISRNSSSNST
jgi:hypothetical protein